MIAKEERLVELDSLRVLSILFIIYWHSPWYILKIPIVEWFRIGAMYTGLGLFVFLSGFGLQYSRLRIKKGTFEPLKFIKARLRRVYPLYIATLLLFVILFHYFQIYHKWHLSPIKEVIFLHLLSLQVLFYPRYPEFLTLWFIGMIIPFYLFFSLTATKNNFGFVTSNLAILLFLLILRYLFHIVDVRLFLYYPIFVVGCLCARRGLNSFDKKHLMTLFVVSGILSFCFYFSFNYFSMDAVLHSGVDYGIGKEFLSWVVILFYCIVSIAFLVTGAFLYSKFTQPLHIWIMRLSNASYAVYLLHRIVYAVSYYFLLEELDLSEKTGTILFPFVTIILFVIADFITRHEKQIFEPALRMIRLLTSRLKEKPLPNSMFI